MTDILAFDTEHKEEFETLLVDEEENYQRDVKSLLDIINLLLNPEFILFTSKDCSQNSRCLGSLVH